MPPAMLLKKLDPETGDIITHVQFYPDDSTLSN